MDISTSDLLSSDSVSGSNNDSGAGHDPLDSSLPDLPEDLDIGLADQ